MARPFVTVITTVQAPTHAVIQLADRLSGMEGAQLIVIGDQNGPARYDLPGADFFSLERQLTLNFKLTQALPTHHYARKNLGYLLAVRRGAACIYETDDDNTPLATWAPRAMTVSARRIASPEKWVNVYRLFTDKWVWPRGFPLSQIKNAAVLEIQAADDCGPVPGAIQQGLANGAPDVDALWRLLLDETIEFEPAASVALAPGTWCPFNSQSTWWWPAAYPLLYLPSFCSFRITDIWRSFVAQRCLWELPGQLIFHSAEVCQDRNAHNFMRDFQHEVPGYLNNESIGDCLSALRLAVGPENLIGNMVACYEALICKGFLPADEMALLQLFLQDVEVNRTIPHRAL
jgi:hypothetical protein